MIVNEDKSLNYLTYYELKSDFPNIAAINKTFKRYKQLLNSYNQDFNCNVKISENNTKEVRAFLSQLDGCHELKHRYFERKLKNDSFNKDVLQLNMIIFFLRQILRMDSHATDEEVLIYYFELLEKNDSYMHQNKKSIAIYLLNAFCFTKKKKLQNICWKFIAKHKLGNLLLKTGDRYFDFNGDRIPFFKHILASFSKVFKRMFFGRLKESREKIIHLPEDDPEVFKDMLLTIYQGEVLNDPKKLLKVLEISQKYQIDQVYWITYRKLKLLHKEGKIEGNLFEIYDYAILLGVQEVIDYIHNYLITLSFNGRLEDDDPLYLKARKDIQIIVITEDVLDEGWKENFFYDDLFRQFSFVKNWSLYKCSGVSDRTIAYLLYYCEDIEALDLGGQHSVCDLCLKMIAETYPKIKNLNLEHCQQLTDVGLTTVVNTCKELKTLKLNQNPCNYTDKSLIMIGKNCPKLKEFVLSIPKKNLITEDGIISLLKNCSNLRFLVLGEFDFCTDDLLKTLFECCPKLTHIELTIRGVGRTPDVIKSFAINFPKLNFLYLNFGFWHFNPVEEFKKYRDDLYELTII